MLDDEGQEAFRDLRGSLRDQAEYYSARAPEYDDWYFRRGRYDRGSTNNARWFEELESARAWVRDLVQDLRPRSRILELACGTGLWTELLADLGGYVTAVDASPSMLQIARSRVSRSTVEYVEADVFSFEPPDTFDLVFFSFWLSHVPRSLFGAFWEMVGRALTPHGRALFVDSLYEESSTARDHELPDPSADTVLRKLDDGREFRIVKIFYQPDDLRMRLRASGWAATVDSTGRYFLLGTASKP